MPMPMIVCKLRAVAQSTNLRDRFANNTYARIHTRMCIGNRGISIRKYKVDRSWRRR